MNAMLKYEIKKAVEGLRAAECKESISDDLASYYRGEIQRLKSMCGNSSEFDEMTKDENQ